MDPQQLMAQGRALMIEQLNIGHLSEEEQNEILDGLGEVLLRRVLLKLVGMLPEAERPKFGTLLASQDMSALQELVAKYVPNSTDVIQEELRAGVEEHKRLVAEEVAKRTATAS